MQLYITVFLTIYKGQNRMENSFYLPAEISANWRCRAALERRNKKIDRITLEYLFSERFTLSFLSSSKLEAFKSRKNAYDKWCLKFLAPLELLYNLKIRITSMVDIHHFTDFIYWKMELYFLHLSIIGKFFVKN